MGGSGLAVLAIRGDPGTDDERLVALKAFPQVDVAVGQVECARPEAFEFEPFPWSHENGGGESTQGARLTVRGERGEFITVLYPGPAPTIAATPSGVAVGKDEVAFAGDLASAGAGTPAAVTVKRGGREVLRLAESEIDLERSQGEIGLFVPDVGYPFGRIPDWLVRQRARGPASGGRGE